MTSKRTAMKSLTQRCKPGNLSEIAKQLAVAIMLLPPAKDRLNGPTFEELMALIETTFGENSPRSLDCHAVVTNALH